MLLTMDQSHGFSHPFQAFVPFKDFRSSSLSRGIHLLQEDKTRKTIQLCLQVLIVELQQLFHLFGIHSLRVYLDTKFTIQIFAYIFTVRTV